MIQEILDAMPEAVIICNGRTQAILAANIAASKLFGYSKKEFFALRITDLVPDDLRNKHDQHVAEYETEPRQRAMGSGLPLFGKTKAGETIPLDIALGPYAQNGVRFVVALITKRENARLVDILTVLLGEIKTVNESLSPPVVE